MPRTRGVKRTHQERDGRDGAKQADVPSAKRVTTQASATAARDETSAGTGAGQGSTNTAATSAIPVATHAFYGSHNASARPGRRDRLIPIDGAYRVRCDRPPAYVGFFINPVASTSKATPTDHDLKEALRALGQEDGHVLHVQVCDRMRDWCTRVGVPAQDRVSVAMVRTLVRLIHNSPRSVVVEAAARALCAVTAKHPRRQADALQQHAVEALVLVVQRVAIDPGARAGLAKRGLQRRTGAPAGDVESDSDDEWVAAVDLDTIAAASASCWALCSLCTRQPGVQSTVARDAFVQQALSLMLASPQQEPPSASAWLVCNMSFDVAELQQLLVTRPTAPLVGPLVALMGSGSDSAKGLACWAARSLVVGYPAGQAAVLDAGVMSQMVGLLELSSAPSTQASAAWLLGTLATGFPRAQHAVLDTPGCVNALTALLRSPVAQVQGQAAAAVYNSAARNNAAQTAFAAAGAIPVLCSLLYADAEAQPKLIEKVLAALLCLALRHSENQHVVAKCTPTEGIPNGRPAPSSSSGSGTLTSNTSSTAIPRAIALMSAGTARVQGLAAGFVRTVVAADDELQARFGMWGAIPPLIGLLPSTDTFVQEQAAAALYNLTCTNAGNLSGLVLMGGIEALKNVVTACTPSSLGHTCACMALWVAADRHAAVMTDLRNDSRLRSSVLALTQSENERLRENSLRLYRALRPEATESLDRLGRSAVFDLLPERVLEAGGGGGGGGGSGEALTCGGMDACAICLGPFEAGNRVCTIPCLHAFHSGCIRRWLVEGPRDACPLCNAAALRPVHGMLQQGTSQVPAPVPSTPPDEHAGREPVPIPTPRNPPETLTLAAVDAPVSISLDDSARHGASVSAANRSAAAAAH